MEEELLGAPSPEGTSAYKEPEEQARDQTGQARIRVHVDERNVKTSYANGFRPTVTAEEVTLDFGTNTVLPQKPGQSDREMVFAVNNRIILNLYSTKRLAISLGQIVRRYEQEFGVLELNAAKRRTQAGS
jgi:hypothetical protein